MSVSHTEHSAHPVIVLVHGAWADASSWSSVISELTFMAKRAGAHITDVDAGHLSLISEPSVVTRVILEAVRAAEA